MARRGSPTQLPLGDVDMTAYGFGDEASRKVRRVGPPEAGTLFRSLPVTSISLWTSGVLALRHGRRSLRGRHIALSSRNLPLAECSAACRAQDFISGAAPDQADHPFCDSLTDYNWQSTDLEGLLRWAHPLVLHPLPPGICPAYHDWQRTCNLPRFSTHDLHAPAARLCCQWCPNCSIVFVHLTSVVGVREVVFEDLSALSHPRSQGGGDLQHRRRAAGAAAGRGHGRCDAGHPD